MAAYKFHWLHTSVIGLQIRQQITVKIIKRESRLYGERNRYEICAKLHGAAPSAERTDREGFESIGEVCIFGGDRDPSGRWQVTRSLNASEGSWFATREEATKAMISYGLTQRVS